MYQRCKFGENPCKTFQYIVLTTFGMHGWTTNKKEMTLLATLHRETEAKHDDVKGISKQVSKRR